MKDTICMKIKALMKQKKKLKDKLSKFKSINRG